MTTETLDASGLGPQLNLEDLTILPEIADRMGTLYGSAPPTTGAEWVETMRSVSDEIEGEPPTADDLCTTDDGLHAFVNDDREQEYVCVLDPLIVPFLVGEPGTVRSTTPERDERIEITVGEDGIDYSHPEAVISLGISDHVAADEEPTFERIYTQVCGYIHVFADEAEYETWAEDVEAATAPLPVEAGVAISRELAGALFDSAA